MSASETKLNLDDLKRIRDRYNSSSDSSDKKFFGNELFRGLDSIIEQIECIKRTPEEIKLMTEKARSVVMRSWECDAVDTAATIVSVFRWLNGQIDDLLKDFKQNGTKK